MDDDIAMATIRFFALTVVLSIPLWIAGPLLEQILGQELPLNLPLSAFQFVIPLIVALHISYGESGRSGIRKLLQRVLDFRRIQKKVWYLLIFFTMPAILLISVAIMRLEGMRIPKTHISPISICVLFIVFFVSAGCEEVGWQGIAYDKLVHQWNSIRAGLFIGAIWSVWHVIPHTQQGYTGEWILWQSVYSIGLRLLIIWVYNNTGKSLFAATVFHAMSNVSVYLLPNDGAVYDPQAASMAIWAVVVFLTALRSPKVFSRSPSFEIRNSSSNRL
jgi:membrane protease YdiL (CAAX protease family)